MALSPQGTDKQGNYWWAENSSKNYLCPEGKKLSKICIKMVHIPYWIATKSLNSYILIMSALGKAGQSHEMTKLIVMDYLITVKTGCLQNLILNLQLHTE